jgi:hypothetical protein
MKRFLTGIILFFSISSLAQPASTGNWFIYFGNQKVSSKWNWHSEVQYRNYNAAGDLEQLLLRTGIGHNLTANNNNLLLGYAYILSKPYIGNTDEKKTVNEHRLFQQFITKQTMGRVNLLHRYRIEERFFTDDVRLRFRYFLSINVPLNKKEMGSNALYASAYNEIFVNHKSAFFDRNRVYGAMGYCFSKYVRAELGLMTQILEKTKRTQFQVVVFNNLPFTKD